MIHETETVTDKRGLKIFRQWWLPEGQPKAVVVICHGLNEHSGRYEYFADALVKSGYAVYTLDHVSHGQSEGKRGHVDGWDHWVENVLALTEDAAKKHPDLPIVLFGHSMGGAIAVHAASSQPSRYTCLVLSGPNVGPVGATWIEHKLINIVSRFAPSVPVAAIPPENICSKKEVVDAYLKDPLNTIGKMAAGMCKTALDINAEACQPAVQEKLTMPVYLAHGAEDKICLASSTERWFEQIPHDKKTYKKWDKLYHEILNEETKDEVIADMVAFMDKNLVTAN